MSITLTTALVKADHLVIDDHCARPLQLAGHAHLECVDGKIKTVALAFGDVFCLNEVELYKGELHLTKWSVGGNVEVSAMNKEGFKQAIAEYNATHDSQISAYWLSSKVAA